MIHAFFILYACSTSLVVMAASIATGDEDGARIGAVMSLCVAFGSGMTLDLLERFRDRQTAEVSE